MPAENILFEICDRIAYITLNRPEAFNGINPALARELVDAAIRCDEDPEIRAVVLTGAGKAFCGGGDLRYFAESGDAVATALKNLTIHANAYMSHFVRMAKPLITAVNGVAAGGGLSIALAGDLIIAAESATFVAAYTAAGLSPDAGMSFFLPRMIGLARTREMMLTNRRIKAPEALMWGMINKCVPDAELMGEAESAAKQLAAGPAGSFGMVKQLLLDCYSETLETKMEQEARGIADMAKSADGREGINAFLQKRKPRFAGR